ncbi:hypothetical protein [Actibacterium pelagium]|uniref:Uncharacterized protein n=1 Tax=Actibacterium pelagium TaxID=2029103 RepID=A0A917ACR9_9RHOB|nr:hypothetical protein [Actibacterium pelagium]GGE41998.1 hypothetical protein GCM10011517_07000 [Actibacterium pelagium]
MFWRAVLLLILVAGASIALTYAFGAKVLLALGLILSQLKIIGSKLMGIEAPAILIWLKTQAAMFFRIELLKKWFMSSMLPLIMGPMLRRKIVQVLTRYKDAVKQRYDSMLAWYRGLEWYEKTVAALIVVFGTIGLSVSSLGLWLVLFSVKLPFWLIAASTALGRMIVASVSKMAFKTIAFLQLGFAWRLVRRWLPKDYLDRKRRWDFRVARAVVRQRRLTVRQLHDSKHSLSMRLALLRAYFRTERPKIASETNETAQTDL